MAEKLLIIDDDLDTLRLVGLMLQRQGYKIVAATNGQQGLAKAVAESPDLILLDVMMPSMDGYEVARHLRINPKTVNIPILMFTAKAQMDDKVTGFESGADDYLTKPTNPSELVAHVQTLLARMAPLKRKTHLIGVLSARGGQGVSTVAINLAGSLYTKTKENVIVAELTPGLGTLGLDLGITNSKGLMDILSSDPSAITAQKVKSSLITHDSGIQLLLASDQPRDVQFISALQQFEILVKSLASMARFVILDFGAGLPPYVRKLLRECDETLVLVEGLPNSILHTRGLIDNVIALGIDKRNIIAVLNNRVWSEMLIQSNEVQEGLQHTIPITIPSAPVLFYQANAAHKPLVLHRPESQFSQQFSHLASLIVEHETPEK